MGRRVVAGSQVVLGPGSPPVGSAEQELRSCIWQHFVCTSPGGPEEVVSGPELDFKGLEPESMGV